MGRGGRGKEEMGEGGEEVGGEGRRWKRQEGEERLQKQFLPKQLPPPNDHWKTNTTTIIHHQNVHNFPNFTTKPP